MKPKTPEKEYNFIDKALFFPKSGILAIGDLHLGFEESLRQSGILVPERQIKDIIKNLQEIFDKIETLPENNKIKRIIFLGDIKHAFYFEREELRGFNQITEFLQGKFSEENIILVKGNHDTIDYSLEHKMKPYYIDEEILFIHGHKPIPKPLLSKISTIVMGHTHPSFILSSGAKREAYKCFLEGKFNGKTTIVMPSFLDIVEGTPVNSYREDYIEDFSAIPKKDIMKFRIWAIGNNEVLDFGKIKDWN